MFGSSKRHVFKPTAYGTTRRQRRIPRWLVLMLTGIILGSGGVLFLQKSYGPVRLTVEQSEQLHYDLNSANMDRQRLQSQLTQTTRELDKLKSSLQSQTAEVQQARAHVEKVNRDLELFATAMPEDPRGTSPGIRAASFQSEAGQLAYQLLIMQDKAKADTFNGQVQLVVSGRYPNGKSGSVELPTFPIALERYTHTDGQLPLPEGFRPRQVTIKITPEGSEKVVATRIIRVAS